MHLKDDGASNGPYFHPPGVEFNSRKIQTNLSLQIFGIDYTSSRPSYVFQGYEFREITCFPSRRPLKISTDVTKHANALRQIANGALIARRFSLVMAIASGA